MSRTVDRIKPTRILLAGVLIGIFLYGRLLGSRTIEEYV